jgi:hypothetical protein
MIYSPIQLAFIKFLKACITKNKKYGYINLTNKQIAERFQFQEKKFSLDHISKLVQKVKHEFTLQSKGSTRYILPKNAICQTAQNNLSDNTEQVQSKYTAICQTVQPRQETLEPQGLEDLLLSINLKNQDQVKEKKIQTKKKNPLESELAVSPSATLSSKDDVMFEEAYQAHRQGEHTGRSSKALSWKKWQLLKREKALPERETILKAIKVYREANPDAQFRQGFQVFLNARSWLDVDDVTSLDDIRRQIQDKQDREAAEYYADPEAWKQNHTAWRAA